MERGGVEWKWERPGAMNPRPHTPRACHSLSLLFPSAHAHTHLVVQAAPQGGVPSPRPKIGRQLQRARVPGKGVGGLDAVPRPGGVIGRQGSDLGGHGGGGGQGRVGQGERVGRVLLGPGGRAGGGAGLGGAACRACTCRGGAFRRGTPRWVAQTAVPEAWGCRRCACAPRGGRASLHQKRKTQAARYFFSLARSVKASEAKSKCALLPTGLLAAGASPSLCLRAARVSTHNLAHADAACGARVRLCGPLPVKEKDVDGARNGRPPAPTATAHGPPHAGHHFPGTPVHELPGRL